MLQQLIRYHKWCIQLKDVVLYTPNLYGPPEYQCVKMCYGEIDEFHAKYIFFKSAFETIALHLIFAACVPMDQYNELNWISNENKNKV